MKNINLLPKIPLIRRMYIPLIIGTLIVSVTFAGGLLFYGIYLKAGTAQKETQSKELSNSIQALRLQKTLDNQTKDYQSLAADVAIIKQSRRFWLPLMELTTTQLPEVARIISMNIVAGTNGGNSTSSSSPQPSATGKQAVGAEKQLAITAEFGELVQVAEYVLRLQQSPLLGNVTIKSMQRVEGEIPIPPVPVPVIPPTESSSPPPLSKEEEMTKIIEDQIAPAETKGEELLNQLRLLMDEQMYEQQFDVELPDLSSRASDSSKTYGSNSFEEIIQGSSITLKELNEARKQIEQFKKFNLPETPTTVSPSPIATVPAGGSQAKKYAKYQVQLELSLKEPIQGK
jgi:hypothetical protein